MTTPTPTTRRPAVTQSVSGPRLRPVVSERPVSERPVLAVRTSPLPAATLLGLAHRGLRDAEVAVRPVDRYAAAHLSALRAAAAVLACRARPTPTTGRRVRPTSAWVLLTAVAPELGEWADFFAAGARKRAAAEAGVPTAVTPREADDLIRDAQSFLHVVEAFLVGADQHPILLPHRPET